MALDVKYKDAVELEVTGAARPAPVRQLGKLGNALIKHFEQYPDLLRQDTSTTIPAREDL